MIASPLAQVLYAFLPAAGPPPKPRRILIPSRPHPMGMEARPKVQKAKEEGRGSGCELKPCAKVASGSVWDFSRLSPPVGFNPLSPAGILATVLMRAEYAGSSQPASPAAAQPPISPQAAGSYPASPYAQGHAPAHTASSMPGEGAHSWRPPPV